MLSVLGREARRLPGVRSLVRPSIDSALASPQAPSQSRLLGTSDLCICDRDEPSRRDVRRWVEGREGARGVVHSLPTTCTVWNTSRWARPVEKWGESDFSLKFAETLQGVRQAATDLLSPWDSPIAPGFGQPTLLPQQSLEHDQGFENGEEDPGISSEGGLWATSVKRKRVTKMRKHKWRKRRKLERQSASRRVNK